MEIWSQTLLHLNGETNWRSKLYGTLGTLNQTLRIPKTNVHPAVRILHPQPLTLKHKLFSHMLNPEFQPGPVFLESVSHASSSTPSSPSFTASGQTTRVSFEKTLKAHPDHTSSVSSIWREDKTALLELDACQYCLRRAMDQRQDACHHNHKSLRGDSSADIPDSRYCQGVSRPQGRASSHCSV
jgi:hypothetical protein